MALPGVRTVLKDRFYILSRTDIPAGPRLCVLGRRSTVDGTSDGAVAVPCFDPYLATNEQAVLNAFGSGSELHRAYIEAVAGGATQIYLVAIPSNAADSDLYSTATTFSYNSSTVNILDAAMGAAETVLPDIIVPWGRGGHPTEYTDPAATLSDPAFGFYANNASGTSTSMAKRVADWVELISDRSHPVFAVLGVKPFVPSPQLNYAQGPNVTAGDLATLLLVPNLISRDAGTAMDNGHFLSLVHSELTPLGYDASWGFSNGAVLYAGMLCQLQSWSSTTGKIVFNVETMRYNPTRTQQQNLIDKGIVPVALDFQRRATWIDGTTFSKTGSDYARLSTLRIVFDALQLVRQVAERFIGEAATLQHRNAFETAISSGLRGMQQLGALIASDFIVTYLPAQNKATVDLSLTPAFELRNIDISVAVQLG